MTKKCRREAGIFEFWSFLASAEIRPAALRRRRGSVALVAEADAPALQIVGRHFDDHAVTDSGADAELAHLAGGVGQHLVLVIELYPEIPVRQHFGHRAVEFQQFFLRHPIPLPVSRPISRTLGRSTYPKI